MLTFLSTQDPEAPSITEIERLEAGAWDAPCVSGAQPVWEPHCPKEVNLNSVTRLLLPSSNLWLSNTSPASLPAVLPHLSKTCFRILELFCHFLPSGLCAYCLHNLEIPSTSTGWFLPVSRDSAQVSPPRLEDAFPEPLHLS